MPCLFTLLLLALQLLLFFPSTTHSLTPGTVPSSKSPDTLPFDPSIAPSTNLSSLPSQIFVIDGELDHLVVILNCVASLLRFPTTKLEEVYVMTYSSEITYQLESVGVRTLYRPDWLAEAIELGHRYHCKSGGKQWMSLMVYMKQRLFVELAYREIRFMMLDSDMLVRTNPMVVMQGEGGGGDERGVDAVMYGSASVSMGAILHWTKWEKTKGKFGVKNSPGAYLSPSLLLPLWRASMECGLALWRKCVRGWGQVALSGLLYQLGLTQWEKVIGNSVYRSTWVPLNSTNYTNTHTSHTNTKPTKKTYPTPMATVGGVVEATFFEEVWKQFPRDPVVVAVDLDQPALPIHHFSVVGGPKKKEQMMRNAGLWFLRKDWESCTQVHNISLCLDRH